jgi:hypothetical protein
VTRRSPLENRRFRSLLLALAGIPILLLYIWQSVIVPIAFGGYLGDLKESYLRGAAQLVAGRDPYDLCHGLCLDPSGQGYVTPPPVAWLLQPVVGLDSHAVAVGTVLFLNASLVTFLVCMVRALRVVDWQLRALLVLVAIAFEPVNGNIVEGQINLVLLALSGVWILGWIADRWWGGAALGLAVALKLIQAPLGLLLLWGRRWSMLAAGIVAGLAIWLLAVPQYLPEFLLKVLPAISQGTGFFENHSPGGTIARLFDPNTFLGATRAVPLPARIITIAIAIGALGVTFWVLGRPREDWSGRALEVAAVTAVGPLVTSYSWGTHLVLLLVPMLVLLEWGVRRRDWTVLGLVALGWLLIGPGHNLFQTLLVSGYSNLAVLRLMAEFGVVGITSVWVASLLALRRQRTDLIRLTSTVPTNRKTTALEKTTR